MFAALASAAIVALGGCDHGAPVPAPSATPVDTTSPAPSSSSPSVTAGSASCERLVKLSLPHVTITDARAVASSPASSDGSPALPATCRVHGTSRPTSDSEIRFSVVIPAGDAWNGRYMQLGNGGFAGVIREQSVLNRVALGYAAAGTDDGHQSTDPSSTDASWALGHPEKVIDFGYRALKETTDAARAIILAYAGRAAAHSYFFGCSDGGREALMEAQRYPDDFDGVVAGAPANHWTNLFYGAVWAERALLATPESYLPPSKLPALENAALKACGDEDRVVEDPLLCHFDPGVLRCKGADSDGCLTDAQIKTVRAIYAGPKGLMPGYEPGAEAENQDEDSWQGWLVGKEPGAAGGAALYLFAENFFRNMVFSDPTYDIRKFRFDVDVATAEKLAPILSSYDADLSAFRKRGGKLIQYHGWSDAAIPPRDSIDYYEAVQAKMGDPRSFYRLFMAPGMLHCNGGNGPDVLETLPAIIGWVEGGKAPDRVLASKTSGAGANARVVRTRPLCPYPESARWDGKGDRARAESYACAAPLAPPRPSK
jgi:Tannase and feruloyl esterase